MKLQTQQDSVGSVEEGFTRARQEEYIFFYGGAIVTFEANTKPCNLQIIGEQLFSFGWELVLCALLVDLETTPTTCTA